IRVSYLVSRSTSRYEAIGRFDSSPVRLFPDFVEDQLNHGGRSADRTAASLPLERLRLFNSYLCSKTLDVVRPAQLGAGIEQRRSTGSDGLAKAVRRMGARAEAPDQGCKKAVSSANRAARLDGERPRM